MGVSLLLQEATATAANPLFSPLDSQALPTRGEEEICVAESGGESRRLSAWRCSPNSWRSFRGAGLGGPFPLAGLAARSQFVDVYVLPSAGIVDGRQRRRAESGPAPSWWTSCFRLSSLSLSFENQARHQLMVSRHCHFTPSHIDA